MIKHTMGERIRRIRTRRKIETTEIAESCKLTVAAIRHYENNIREPKEDTLKQIASALGVDVSALYDRKIESISDIMHILFELENDGLITPFSAEDVNGHWRGCYVRSLSEVLNEAIKLWRQERLLLETEQISDNEYRDWKDSFPLQYSAETKETPDSKAATSEEEKPKKSGDPRARKLGGLLLQSYESRCEAVKTISEISAEQIAAICRYVNCSEDFLIDRKCLQYSPIGEFTADVHDNEDTLFDILDLMDLAPETEEIRTIQIQLSRIVLYNLGQAGLSRDDLQIRQLSQSKLNYLYSGKIPKLRSSTFGFSYSELAVIRRHYNIEYQEMFTGRANHLR